MTQHINNSRKRFYELERVFKGAANHRRLEILALLKARKDVSTEEIVDAIKIHYQTASEHLGRLIRAGLVVKYREGNIIRYTLTDIAHSVINLWQKL